MTELTIHLVAALACLYLFKRAPDWVQKGILLAIASAMFIHTFSDLLKLYGVGNDEVTLFGFEHVWQARIYAYGIGHFALLCYIVRQVWLTTGICKLVKHVAEEVKDAG